MPLFLLLDGNSVAYRAFFALPTDMATASGQVTNAVYGFTSMLINLLKDHRPDRIAVAFDRPEPTFRHQMIADYKAGRSEAPDILRQQMGLVRQVVGTLHIPTIELAGFEADDVIATLATQARDEGLDVIIVTGDRDTYQLVEDSHVLPGGAAAGSVKVLYNRRGVSDYVLYDEAGIRERTGVTPSQYPQYAALRGDPSDNLAGVPGVGEKTAARLINTYGDLDGIFAHLDELTPKLRQSMADAEPMVRRNAQATPLVRDVPLDVDLDGLVMDGWDFEEVRRLFNFLEFRTLWDRLLEVSDSGEKVAAAASAAGARFEVDVEEIPTTEAARELIEAWCRGGTALAMDAAWAGRAGRSPLEGLALVELPASAEQGPIPVMWFGASLLAAGEVRAALSRLLGPGGAAVSSHDAKSLMRGLSVTGVDFSHLELDTAIGAYTKCRPPVGSDTSVRSPGPASSSGVRPRDCTGS